jgi:putative ABC transport system permease protein
MPSSFRYMPLRFPSFVLRSRLQPTQVMTMVRSELRAIDRNIAEERITTLPQAISDAGAKPRFYATMLAVFALLALSIAAVGIYGLIHYSVSSRTHEFGIRMAVGAGRGAILRMVLKQGAVIAGCGMTTGLAGTWALTRLLRSWLFQIKPTDPFALVTACGILTAVALVACFVPARRATKVDPMEALRCE